MTLVARTPTILTALISRSSSATGVEHEDRAADENWIARLEKRQAGREPKPVGRT